MSIKALLGVAVAALAMLAPVAIMAQGMYGPGPSAIEPGPTGPYYSHPNQGIVPRPDFPGPKQQTAKTSRHRSKHAREQNY